jgi:hypothetical protein
VIIHRLFSQLKYVLTIWLTSCAVGEAFRAHHSYSSVAAWALLFETVVLADDVPFEEHSISSRCSRLRFRKHLLRHSSFRCETLPSFLVPTGSLALEASLLKLKFEHLW